MNCHSLSILPLTWLSWLHLNHFIKKGPLIVHTYSSWKVSSHGFNLKHCQYYQRPTIKVYLYWWPLIHIAKHVFLRWSLSMLTKANSYKNAFTKNVRPQQLRHYRNDRNSCVLAVWSVTIADLRTSRGRRERMPDGCCGFGSRRMCRMMEASSHYAVSRLVLVLLFVLNNSEGMLFFWEKFSSRFLNCFIILTEHVLLSYFIFPKIN